MTITTVSIACDVGLPDNTEFTASRLDFTLSGPDYDTVSNDAIPAATVSVALDASGIGTALLWPVDRGVRNTKYSVTLVGSRTVDGRVQAQTYSLGTISPPSAVSPHDLADLLAQSSGGIVVGSTIYETLADAVAAAIEAEAAAVAAAETAAENAAAGADPIAAIAARDAAIAAGDAAADPLAGGVEEGHEDEDEEEDGGELFPLVILLIARELDTESAGADVADDGRGAEVILDHP